MLLAYLCVICMTKGIAYNAVQIGAIFLPLGQIDDGVLVGVVILVNYTNQNHVKL